MPSLTYRNLIKIINDNKKLLQKMKENNVNIFLNNIIISILVPLITFLPLLKTLGNNLYIAFTVVSSCIGLFFTVVAYNWIKFLVDFLGKIFKEATFSYMINRELFYFVILELLSFRTKFTILYFKGGSFRDYFNYLIYLFNTGAMLKYFQFNIPFIVVFTTELGILIALLIEVALGIINWLMMYIKLAVMTILAITLLVLYFKMRKVKIIFEELRIKTKEKFEEPTNHVKLIDILLNKGYLTIFLREILEDKFDKLKEIKVIQ